MIDRAIGLAGIALTLIILVLQYYLPHLPTWGLIAGFGMGVFFVGLSAGLPITGGLRQKRKPVATALLRLHI